MKNINTRFLEEAKELEKRWAKTGLLDGITDKYSRGVTAVLLESLRLMNELAPPPEDGLCPRCHTQLYADIPGHQYRCKTCNVQYKLEWSEGKRMTVKCLICEEDIEYDGELVCGGGFAYIEFHYGSKHDQGKGCGGRPELGDPILQADEIEAYICDSCFDKKKHLCRGFRVRTKKERTLCSPSSQQTDK